MNEKLIWDYLIKNIKNPYGVAAIMGNLMAESSLNPLCANGVKKKYGWTNEEYVKHSDLGEHDFANDGVAFGLVQWCFKTRKTKLMQHAKDNNSSVGDIHRQLSYLLYELPKYKTAYNTVLNTNDIKEATTVVMRKYENPADQSLTAKEKRIKYAQSYFNKYADVNETIDVTMNKNLWERLFNTLKHEL